MDNKHFVCLNNGRGTRIDIRTGKESVIDLTIVSSRLASKCEWEIEGGSAMGSDHYLIVCKIDVDVRVSIEDSHGRWIFKKADWERFMETSDLHIRSVQITDDVE